MKLTTLFVAAFTACAPCVQVAMAQAVDSTRAEATSVAADDRRPGIDELQATPAVEQPVPTIGAGLTMPRFFPATTTQPDASTFATSTRSAASTGSSGSAATVFFKTVGHDVTGFFNRDTAKLLVVFGVAGAGATHWDSATVEDAQERLPSSAYRVGNMGGSLAVQMGAGVASYVIGRMTDEPELASLGGDIVRAQILSQIFVQGTKLVAERQRPDGSDAFSFPSGHSASAFATATVLQEHFGWRAGVPAYAFAGFVAASRMAADKHYLSDVLLGAGIGIAAGRTVTVHVRGERFAIGAAPTAGGAMVTFTKR